jgi:hypothetical protein
MLMMSSLSCLHTSSSENLGRGGELWRMNEKGIFEKNHVKVCKAFGMKKKGLGGREKEESGVN